MRERRGDDEKGLHRAHPDAVTQGCWWAHEQWASAWSNAIDVRLHPENRAFRVRGAPFAAALEYPDVFPTGATP